MSLHSNSLSVNSEMKHVIELWWYENKINAKA